MTGGSGSQANKATANKATEVMQPALRIDMADRVRKTSCEILLFLCQFLLNSGVKARVNALYCIARGRGFAFAGEASIPLL